MPLKAADSVDKKSSRSDLTYEALVAAGQEIFAIEGPDVAVKTITDAAGVGVGSFYNHFEKKCNLYDAACFDADAQLTKYLDERVAGIENPDERFCARLRNYVQSDEDLPTVARLLSRSDSREVVRTKGYEEDLRADLDAGLAAGVFRCDNPDLALSVINATCWTLLQSRTSRLSWAGVETSEVIETVAYLMTLVGLPEREATKMARAARR